MFFLLRCKNGPQILYCRSGIHSKTIDIKQFKLQLIGAPIQSDVNVKIESVILDIFFLFYVCKHILYRIDTTDLLSMCVLNRLSQTENFCCQPSPVTNEVNCKYIRELWQLHIELLIIQSYTMRVTNYFMLLKQKEKYSNAATELRLQSKVQRDRERSTV